MFVTFWWTYIHDYICACIHTNSLQSCMILLCSREIIQARILEWVAMMSSRGSSWPRVQTRLPQLLNCRQILLSHWGSPYSWLNGYKSNTSMSENYIHLLICLFQVYFSSASLIIWDSFEDNGPFLLIFSIMHSIVDVK